MITVDACNDASLALVFVWNAILCKLFSHAGPFQLSCSGQVVCVKTVSRFCTVKERKTPKVARYVTVGTQIGTRAADLLKAKTGEKVVQVCVH